MTTLTTAKEKLCRSMLCKVGIYEKMLLTAQEDKDTQTIKHLYQQHTHLMNRLERLLCS
ncbi:MULTISPECIES: hypothetical protein [Prochlorococcus]|uniref:hypothetical protein n=1 Tax=Prochlorococcus TaxID=1218 RepID=UPI0007BC6ABB|nr:MULTISPECIES: hypothetical protein [Prochlorococcus]KZR79208.1 hypothetical protein PMIT1327_02415 [Prochlorococcus marinus str. MIT 1327]KZR64643.1 hypothetical protein PMIT1312_01362 [Prochlorococcus marinus str. MIT 1312]NMO84233.1 hypothetical protein [Prochlorococcus sp. P1344]NMP07145.1 hypothetical protein [Prochlorococcus sp. P1361]NMP12341.1 hypothetical protein [Prochlorococcus sp.P1363]